MYSILYSKNSRLGGPEGLRLCDVTLDTVAAVWTRNVSNTWINVSVGKNWALSWFLALKQWRSRRGKSCPFEKSTALALRL